MLLDNLVTAIQTVQQRIHEHGNTLSQNEYRTRLALIDPILNALGWDASDPKLVTPEYQVGSGRADYALLGEDGKPQAFIEAKRLGEMAEASKHETQLFTYAVTQGVRYAGLTDGNRWIFDNLSARFSGGESRLLDVTISKELAHQCALKFLLLWHPTLVVGQPIEANAPVLGTPTKPEPPIKSPDPVQPIQPTDEGWISLGQYEHGEEKELPKMWLPDKGQVQFDKWYGLLVEIAEWLIRDGKLTADSCPVASVKASTILINNKSSHEDGTEFFHPHVLSNGLYLNKQGNKDTLLSSGKILLERFHKDPAAILLKPGQ